MLALGACAALDEPADADFDSTDYWDSGLVYHQYIDVATLSSGFSSEELVLSGFVSAVAASANDLYFIDEGSGQLVQVDLALMTGRTLAKLQSPAVPGLYADIDGKVYVVDRANNRLLVYDNYLSDVRFLPLGSLLGNLYDVAIGEQGQWLFVLDSLGGRIATLDVFGGVTQIIRPELPSSMSFVRPRAIAVAGSGLMVLDNGADQVIQFDLYGNLVGVYAEDDLRNPKALAADSCGRFFVADDNGLYLGFADMSLPGRNVAVSELAGLDIRDLWTDGVFLFVATRADGIHMLLLDPSCGAP
jgi:DNA-binding beta-propeller fold protein YncE